MCVYLYVELGLLIIKYGYLRFFGYRLLWQGSIQIYGKSGVVLIVEPLGTRVY